MTRQELQLNRLLHVLRTAVEANVLTPKQLDLAAFGEPHAGGDGWVSAVLHDGREPGVGKFLAWCQFLPSVGAADAALKLRALCGPAAVIAPLAAINELASPLEQIGLATQALMSLLLLLRPIDRVQSLATVEVDEPLYRAAVPHVDRAALAVATLSVAVDARLRACLDGQRTRRRARVATPDQAAVQG